VFRMESKATVNLRIFFKDKQNELKGPFTERQVEEWFRKGFFQKTFPFCFANGGENPCADSQFHTLDELCTLNGIGAPFSPLSDVIPPEKRAQAEKRLQSIEEELRSLRVKCDEVLRVKEQIEKMEVKIKELRNDDIQPCSGGAKQTAAAAATAASQQAKNIRVAAVAGKVQPQVDTAAAGKDGREQASNKPERVLPEKVRPFVEFYIRTIDDYQDGTIPK
ncbi:hypothetical protein PMAYCL1PPCAC_00508, partial [Pristionchus mayeri]